MTSQELNTVEKLLEKAEVITDCKVWSKIPGRELSQAFAQRVRYWSSDSTALRTCITTIDRSQQHASQSS